MILLQSDRLEAGGDPERGVPQRHRGRAEIIPAGSPDTAVFLAAAPNRLAQKFGGRGRILEMKEQASSCFVGAPSIGGIEIDRFTPGHDGIFVAPHAMNRIPDVPRKRSVPWLENHRDAVGLERIIRTRVRSEEIAELARMVVIFGGMSPLRETGDMGIPRIILSFGEAQITRLHMTCSSLERPHSSLDREIDLSGGRVIVLLRKERLGGHVMMESPCESFSGKGFIERGKFRRRASRIEVRVEQARDRIGRTDLKGGAREGAGLRNGAGIPEGKILAGEGIAAPGRCSAKPRSQALRLFSARDGKRAGKIRNPLFEPDFILAAGDEPPGLIVPEMEGRLIVRPRDPEGRRGRRGGQARHSGRDRKREGVGRRRRRAEIDPDQPKGRAVGEDPSREKKRIAAVFRGSRRKNKSGASIGRGDFGRERGACFGGWEFGVRAQVRDTIRHAIGIGRCFGCDRLIGSGWDGTAARESEEEGDHEKKFHYLFRKLTLTYWHKIAIMKNTSLKQLHAHGQSIWYDQLDRSLFNGKLARMIDEGLRGMTSNPTIFEKAIAGSDLYADDLRSGGSTQEIYERIVISDIQRAADFFRPVYDASHGEDGYVSLEVNPHLARDTAGTIDEGKHLFKTLDRPNVMIKVPATHEGIPAVEALVALGINVNVTLIFSTDVYREVIAAYRAGLARAKKPVASVASFFISRIDSAVDKALDEKGAPNGAADLRGKTAVANAKMAYQLFLKERTAQRPLWASTSTKNPAYPPLLYVEELIGADTVNTVPPATYESFRDQGRVTDSITSDLEGARATLDGLRRTGIDLDAITTRLTEDGVKLFADSFDKLMKTIEEAR